MEHPFTTLEGLQQGAARVWAGLQRKDWLEAFRAHPNIGDKPGALEKTEKREPPAPPSSATMKSATPAPRPPMPSLLQTHRADKWAEGEQARVREASAALLAELAEINNAYEDKFGFIFIVCATGKSAEEMVAIAKQRMKNGFDEEIQAAAEEQRKITDIRLEKLVLGQNI